LELLQNLRLKDSIPELAHERLFELLIITSSWGYARGCRTFRDERDRLFNAFEKVREKQQH